MITLLGIHKNDKIELIVEKDITNLFEFLSKKNYQIYDTVSAKGITKQNLYKKDGKYYVIGKIKHNKNYINSITLYDITTSIQNPENRL